MYKLIFYVPVNEAQKVKKAVFETGAGSLGNYSHCSWETAGMGQFKPLAESKPAIGDKNQINQVEELRVEILCSEQNIQNAVDQMKSSHPYEEPAYEVIKLESF